MGSRHHLRDRPLFGRFGIRGEARKEAFLGREAAAAHSPDGGEQRLVCLVLSDTRSVALGNEPVKQGAAVVGRVSSGGVGYHLNASIAYAWVPSGLSAPGTPLAVEVFGVEVPAEVRTDPLYDPKGERIRSL